VSPEGITNPIDATGAVEKQVAELAALSLKNHSELSTIVASLLNEPHVNRKLPERILSKATRPQILAKRPWFRVHHIRDSLRFRCSPSTLDMLAEALVVLRDAGLEVVKVDLEKFLNPDVWGWRFAGADLRMRDRLLIEFYATLPEVMEANRTVCHGLFEKWRNVPISERPSEAQDDIEASDAAYEAAWIAALNRLKMSEDDALSAWKSLRERLGR